MESGAGLNVFRSPEAFHPASSGTNGSGHG
jgi:hypothetical protein